MKRDTLFELFKKGGQYIDKQGLSAVKGGTHETDIGEMTDDPDNPGGDPINDCCEDSIRLVIYLW
ncbi:MAG: hypothetical protein KDC66_14165 [Phaeodactylibacter sp.]|nr:hypothetical protein [Phaeodactylibacter sp.]MCB9275533.1 hypothetical protein [Lewinellaceae bacterium]